MRVRCYWNLHRGLWSVQDTKTGRVVDRLAHLTVTDATFVVRPAGREKARREGKKNVHAFVVGEWDGTSWVNEDAGQHAGYDFITYNPFKYDRFTIPETGEEPNRAEEVALFASRRVWGKGLDTA